jgi:urea-proton symporter
MALSSNSSTSSNLFAAGNFGAVFVDQAYWQSAVAATPAASWKGYILGGLCWFSIPFTFATSLGLAANALSLPITQDEADAGLVPPAAAFVLLGNSGSILILVMLFMAVTSAASGEQIAVSSLIAFDVYRTYLNPLASGTRIVKVSRWTILCFGLLMGPVAVALNHMGIALGWLYLFMGVLIGAAVFPIAFSISWLGCSSVAAIAGACLGTVLGLIAWIYEGRARGGGSITLASLGTDEAMLAGNLVSLLSSGIICVLVSVARPARLSWRETTLRIMLVEDDPNAHPSEDMLAALDRAMRKIIFWGVSLALLFVVVWPLAMLAESTFSLGFFTFWAVLSMVWGLVASIIIIFLPLWEYRSSFVDVFRILTGASRPIQLSEAAIGRMSNSTVSDHDSAPLFCENDGDGTMELSLLSESDANSISGHEDDLGKINSFSRKSEISLHIHTADES